MSSIPTHMPLQLILYLTPLPLTLLSLLAPPFSHRGALFSLSIILPLVLAQFIEPFSNNTSTRFSISLLWYLYLGTLPKILFCIPEQTYWRQGHTLEAVQYPAFSKQKLKWAIALLCNNRGIGWNFLVKGVPASPVGESRGDFAKKRVRDMVVVFAMVDVTGLYLRKLHGEEVGGLERLAVVLAIGAQAAGGTSFHYAYMSAFAVGTGLSSPQDWPPLFGEASKTTTLRYFWGAFWHQGIRNILAGYTHFLLSTFRVPRHTALSSILSVVITFTISGLYHGFISYTLPYPSPGSINATVYDRFGRYLMYFLLQPVGILGEDLVIRLYKRYTSSRSKTDENVKEEKNGVRWQQLLGYAWVVVWVLGSGSVLVDSYLKTEMGLVGLETSVTERLFAWFARV